MYFSIVVKKYYLSLFTLSPMILVPHNTKCPLDYLFSVTHWLDKPKINPKIIFISKENKHQKLTK